MPSTITLTASNTASLNSDIQTINAAAPGSSYVINITSNITLTSDLTAINLAAGTSVTINGSGGTYTLDGAGTYSGFFVTTVLHVDHGTLTVSTGHAAVSGSGTGTVTLSGTAAEINATFAATSHLTYHGAAGYAGIDSLTITTDDGGGTGAGGIKTDVDVVSITNVAAPIHHTPNDFNGDGKSDILLRNDAGVAAIWT